MMAELNRKEDQLTTADLAGRREELNRGAREIHQSEEAHRLRLIRTDNPEERVAQTTGRNAAPERENPVSAKPENISTPLFTESDVNDLRGRWANVQTSFVDEPRHAVEEADKLVAAVMQRLAEGFANERSTLEKQWDQGDNVSTEDLRVAMQRYRSFFDRLLNA